MVTVIDHHDVSSKSHGDAMKIIELAGTTLKLNIIKYVSNQSSVQCCELMVLCAPRGVLTNWAEGPIFTVHDRNTSS